MDLARWRDRRVGGDRRRVAVSAAATHDAGDRTVRRSSPSGSRRMNWRRAALASSLAIPVVGLFIFGMKQDPREIPSPLPGHSAPTFSLAVFAPGQPPLTRPIGDTVRLADLKGRVVVLNFWAS